MNQISRQQILKRILNNINIIKNLSFFSSFNNISKILLKSFLVFTALVFFILPIQVYGALGDGVFIYDQTTPTTSVQGRLFTELTTTVGAEFSPFAGSGTSKHIYSRGSQTRNELLLGIQDSAGLLTIYKSTDSGATWVSQWTATVGDGNLKRFDIVYEQISGDALVIYGGNVATTNEIKYQTYNGTTWSGALNLDTIRTSGSIYGIKAIDRNNSNEIGIVWVDTNLDISANVWTGTAWYGEPTAALSTSIARSGGAAPSAVPTRRGYDLSFESLSGDLMVVWGNDSGSTTQTDPKYIIKTAGGAWGAAAGTAITALTEDGEMIDISASPISDKIAFSTCAVDTGADCNAIIWSGTAWGSSSNDTSSAAAIIGESSNNVEWLVDGINEVAIMTYSDAAGGGIDWRTAANGTTISTQADNSLAPAIAGLERAGFAKVNPSDSREAVFIFEDNNADIFIKIARLSGTTVTWSNPTGLAAAIETAASVTGFNPVGFAFVRYVPSVSPTVTTQAVTSITQTTATGNGNVTSDGGSAITERGFVWNTSTNPTTANSKVIVAGTTGAYTGSLTGLTSGTLYYVRSYAINSIGTSYGNEVTFTTTALIPPTVTTSSPVATSVSLDTAVLNGNIVSIGGSPITARGFDYSTSSNLSVGVITTVETDNSYIENFDPATFPPTGWTTGGSVNWIRDTAITYNSSAGSATSSNTVPDNGTSWITHNKTFSSDGEVRFYWKVSSEATYDFLVFCLDLNPTCSKTVFTGSNSISGTVDWVQVIVPVVAGTHDFTWLYGKDLNTIGGSDMGWIDNIEFIENISTGAFTASVTGLICNTTYYARAYATNSDGTNKGLINSFITSACNNLPVVTTQAVTSIAETTATGNGNITSDGGAAITERGFVWNTSTNPTTANSKVIVYTPAGEIWTERTSAGLRSWRQITSSSDGTKLAAVSYGGYIYTSTDSGITWTERTTSGIRNWVSINSSSDGTKLASAVLGGYIYTSIDSGATWTERTSAGSKNWININSSSDGIKLVAVADSSYIYTSIDSGATWTQRTSAGSRMWRKIASSSDGTKLVAVVGNDYIYTSTDSGATWTQITSAGLRGWYSLAISSDGTKLAAGVYNGYIYTSTDSGATWTERISAGSRVWNTIAISSDGIKLAAGVLSSGYIYTSVGVGPGAYAGDLTGLISGTLYYVRSYAINNVGTSYGNEVTFTTTTSQSSPTIVLNTADATNFGTDTTPTLEMTATDGESDSVQYNIQINSSAPSTSRWVAAGSGTNALAYSDDGITWVGLGQSIHSIGYGIAYNGTMWVSVGSGTNHVAYSSNGIDWTGSASGNSLLSTDGSGVAWNGTMWVATGTGAANSIIYSYNGMDWFAATSSKTIFSSYGQRVAWNGTMWVAVGVGANAIAYSYNGIDWTGLGFVGLSTQGNGIAWNGTMWVAVGVGTHSIATSSNGIDWTGITGTTIFSSSGRGIAWNGTMWVAIGNDVSDSLAYSYNGVDWTKISGLTIFSLYGYAVAWNGSMWVAVGNGATHTIATSTNGIDWTGRAKTVFSNYGYDIASNTPVSLVPSISNAPLLDKVSTIDPGFLNTIMTDTAPFNSGQKVSYTVQAGDALTTGTYLWRARAIDPIGSNIYSAWTAFRNFIIAAGPVLLPVGGTLTSSVFDTTANSSSIGYNSIMWKGTLGGVGLNEGKVLFQLAASSSPLGPWNFYGGATCGALDWFDTLGPNTPVELKGSSCVSNWNNKRYFKYKVKICSNDCVTQGENSPTVDNIIVNWSS